MRFELLVLGSSAALPTAERFCSGHLLRVASTHVLIDCGEGTLRQLQAAGAGYGRISLVLITHLHGDHYFGLPGLLTSFSLNDRKKPLTIVSPPGLKDRIAPLIETGNYSMPFDIDFIELALPQVGMFLEDSDPRLSASSTKVGIDTFPKSLFTHGDLNISYFPLEHRVPTAGYLLTETQKLPNIIPEQIARFQIPYTQIRDIKAGADFQTESGEVIPHEDLVTPAPEPRSFAYCSDTRYTPQLAEWVEGVDLLYHEATFLHELVDRAEYTKHSTAREAAQIAKAAQVGKLLIGHFSSRYPNSEILVDEARAVFPETFAARELERHVVPRRKRE
ncbi:MAG: ribonuclease Z [Bacteroidota bacterium]